MIKWRQISINYPSVDYSLELLSYETLELIKKKEGELKEDDLKKQEKK